MGKRVFSLGRGSIEWWEKHGQWCQIDLQLSHTATVCPRQVARLGFYPHNLAVNI